MLLLGRSEASVGITCKIGFKDSIDENQTHLIFKIVLGDCGLALLKINKEK